VLEGAGPAQVNLLTKGRGARIYIVSPMSETEDEGGISEVG